MLKTVLKILAFSGCLMLLMFCSKEPDPFSGGTTNFDCNSPITICSKPDSIGIEFGKMDCDGGGISNLLECRNGTSFSQADDDCAAAVRGKIDICLLIRTNPDGSVGDLRADHVLAQQDCDGGGLTNIEECIKGFNPLKENDLDEQNNRLNDQAIEVYLKKSDLINDTLILLDTIGTIGVIDTNDVIRTESGLIYYAEKIGTGEIATSEDSIEYSFVSSYLVNCGEETTCDTVPIVNQAGDITLVKDLIFGIQEWLSQFPEGSKGKLIIPSRLAYNNLLFQDIPPYSVIVMDIDFIRLL